MEKNKHVRELHRKKFYIAALRRMAEWYCTTSWVFKSGDTVLQHPTWKDLYKANAFKAYRSVRVPCSCEFCSPHTPRSVSKKETLRILREAEIENNLPSGYLGTHSFKWK